MLLKLLCCMLAVFTIVAMAGAALRRRRQR